jgi:hypothetical protein
LNLWGTGAVSACGRLRLRRVACRGGAGVMVRPLQAAGHPDGRGPLPVGCMAWMQWVCVVCARVCGLWSTPGHPVGRIPDPSSVYSTRRCSRDVECVCVAFGAPRGILLGASRTPPAFAVRMQQRCEFGLWSTKAAYRLQHGPLQLLQCGCSSGVSVAFGAPRRPIGCNMGPSSFCSADATGVWPLESLPAPPQACGLQGGRRWVCW